MYRGWNMARITVRTPFNVYYSVYFCPEFTSLLVDVVIVCDCDQAFDAI